MEKLLEQINDRIAAFQKDAYLQWFKGNKAAGRRARKAALELMALLKEFRRLPSKRAGRSDIWYLSIPPFFLLSFRRFYEIGEKDRPKTAGLDKLRYNANHRRWPVASKRGAFESLYRILWRTRRSARSTRS